MSPTAGPRWTPTPSLVGALAAGLLLLVLAAGLHRPLAAVLAAPLLADVAWALRRPVRETLAVRIRGHRARLQEGDDVTVSLGIDVPDDADLLALAIETRPLLDPVGDGRPLARLPARALDLDTSAAHWGRGRSVVVAAAASAGHGLLRAEPVAVDGPQVAVEPALTGRGRAVPMPRLTGVVGPRPSRRPGEGSEFATVRPFVVGDRLRRVNWRVTARRGDLHVTATTADREASIVLVLDTTSELGPPGATSLDHGVRLAADLARRHLAAGDRVGLLDLADPTHPVRPGAGNRHARTLTDALLDRRRSAPADGRLVARTLARVSPDAVLVVLSPLLRPETSATVARLARSGRTVLVADTLPPAHDARPLVTERLARLRHDVTTGQLLAAGVPVVPAAAAGDIGPALQALSRATPARRAR